MRRRTAGVLAAVAALSVVGVPATADPAQDVSVVVPVNAGNIATTFSTVAGRSYSVTVRGLYSHNGTQLADCGHRNVGDVAVTPNYVPVTNLYVNGAGAPCTGQDVTVDHAYTWTMSGTGAPLRFRIEAPSGAAGALTVSVRGFAVTATCDYYVQGLPSSRNVLVTIVVTAEAVGPSDVAYTNVRCALTNAYGESVVAEQTMPGSRLALVYEGVMQASSFTRCLTAHALWALDLRTVTYSDC